MRWWTRLIVSNRRVQWPRGVAIVRAATGEVIPVEVAYRGREDLIDVFEVVGYWLEPGDRVFITNLPARTSITVNTL